MLLQKPKQVDFVHDYHNTNVHQSQTIQLHCHGDIFIFLYYIAQNFDGENL